ncbi:MAG TPA: NAD-dependent epimerase/dehydratase family protein [Candidatus Udaeobacter sp.]|jgi:nucleoside-diphosphate-sugar epimerase|nr:NAD-dependent epimerase/dehydratase family protein [Candidatus Udaeobacter sp.]
MPRVLIAGCGYVGQATADLFHSAGWDVEGWIASGKSATARSSKPYPINRTDISNHHQVANFPGRFDAVIHSASTRGGGVDDYRKIYLNGARNLLDRFAGIRVLFTSSTSVYAQRDGSWVTEESETKPVRETGRVLLETEKLVLGRGGIVIRLAGIYGPGRSALLSKFLAGTAIIDPENDRFVNQVHRDDVASAIFRLLTQEARGSQIFNVVDDQPVLQSDCYRWLAQRLNRGLPPAEKLTTQRKRGESNKRVSNAKLRHLDWIPQYPTFAEGMEKSVFQSFPAVVSNVSQ